MLSVLEEFLGKYTGSFTGSYIAKKRFLNQKSVANTLNKLEDEGLLKSKTMGKNKEFSLNLGNLEVVKNFITAAEHLRTANFFRKHPIIKEALSKSKPAFDGIVIVFGSYAKDTQKKDSDLDVFVAGTYDKNKVSKISELYNLEISVKNYPANAFKRALKNKDILVNEVLKNHVIIAGAEEFVNAIMSDYLGIV
jgi:predicted nucleotidyltransferase